MAKKMLIDATHPEETRVVVVDGNKVDDFDFESINKRQLAGNIYLAKVTRVEPSLQAAFVEYGGNRHGFLAFSEIHPDYYQIPVADREALLEEERREEEARRAREEEGDQPEKPARKRGRRRRKDRDEDSAAADVAGLEVIDIDSDKEAKGPETVEDGGVPRGLEIAEPDDNSETGAEGPLASVEPVGEDAQANDGTVSTEPEVAESVATVDAEVAVESDLAAEAETTAGPEAVAEPDAAAVTPDDDVSTEVAPPDDPGDDSGANTEEVAQVDPAQVDQPIDTGVSEDADSPADEPADEPVGDDDPEAPKTIAEAVGLDDDERVVGDVDGGGDRTLTAEGDDTVVDVLDGAETANVEEGVDPALDQTPSSSAADAAATEAPAPEDSATSGDADSVVPETTSDDAPEDAATETTEPGGATAAQEGEATTDTPNGETAPEADGADDESAKGEAGKSEEDTERPNRNSKRRRRGKRGGRSAGADDENADAPSDRDDSDDDASPDEPEQVGAEDTLEEAARARTRLRRRYKIQDVVKVRQILLVQVVKEERGNKGAALTTYLSLAGRYCVLMPNTARGGGISRKITNASDRKRLREITGGLEVPQGMGLIVRTAGAERTKAEIKRDYEFLIRQWEQIRDLTLKSIAPTLIYEEGSLIKRSIRDIYNKEIDQIMVEGETGYREAKEYMKMLMPSHAKNVQPYGDPIPLFSRYQVESYLNGMFNPTVQLKSGGYIVIGVTEALVAIDVNSGRATKQGSIEETALQTNLEAADEVGRQLRLRDLAGLIVIDFIDMDENRNNRAVEKRMKERLKNDRARIQVGRISAFGLMEMSRQRLRPGMLEATTQTCTACHGTGLIRSDESLSLSILRELEEEALRGRADELILRAPVDVSNYLINSKRPNLAQIEERQDISIVVMADPSLTSPHFEVERSKSQKPRQARRQNVVTAASVVADEDLVEDAVEVRDDDDEDNRNQRRRGRRGGRRRREDRPEAEGQDESQTAAEEDGDGEDDDRPKRRRGRRRGGRNRKGGSEDQQQTASGTESSTDAEAGQTSPDGAPEAAAGEHVATEAAAETADVSEQVSGADTEAVGSVETSTVGDAAEPAATPEAVAEGETAEAAAEPAVQAASDEIAADPEAEVTEAVSEPELVEPVVEEPQAEAAAPAPELEPEPAPDAPSKPKRRGWWSLGR